MVEAALSSKAQDVLALDVRELSSVTETFILATGTSDRHLRSIVDAICEAAVELGEKPLGIEGYTEGRWVLIDLNDVIVHVFLPDVREHYQLERLWSDAPVLHFGGAEPQSATR
ncbi:MAG: ribosome silencing factor [Deltaproteobacteria bacterium]|nr:MAG: ribosome silencing factor [Deltaproteobacteria bacterium]